MLFLTYIVFLTHNHVDCNVNVIPRLHCHYLTDLTTVVLPFLAQFFFVLFLNLGQCLF